MGCHLLKCTCGAKCYFPQRYIVALMSLTGILVAYGHRVSLNIAITVMANKSLSASTSCPVRNVTLTEPQNLTGGVIPWTNSEQNLVLGGFYPGYLIGHVPTGILSDRYGARYVFSIGMAVSTILTLVTPVVVVNAPYYMTIILRNFMGLGQSVVYVAISSLYAKWVPKEERGTLGAFSFAANSLGIICGNFITGMLINFVGNWPVGFYFWGLLGIVWCSFFMLYVYSEPEKSPIITDKEKEFLSQKIHKGSSKLKIPWKGFATDIGIWALIISEIGHDFTVFTLVNNFPKYLSDVLHYDLAENALASSLPYICQWIGGITAGEIVDRLIRKKGYSVLWCRRIVTTIGSVLPATFILAAGYMGCDGALVLTMFTFNLLFKGPIYAAMKVNHLDMSLNFAGIIMALSNGIGALAGYLSPEVINLLAPDNTLDEWRLVFWVVWVAAFVTNAFYFCFSRARRRKWDFPEDEIEEYNQQEEGIKAEKQKKKEAKQAKKDAKKESKPGGSKAP